MTRCLQTTGQGYFEEVEYDLPPLTENEICVRAVMTGVCRSDVDMMMGNFGPLPLHMQGHEGLGQVIGIGANITNVKFGDYVATRGEPAYADFYNVRADEYVQVPEAHPRYILEPVACGINAVDVAYCSRQDKILIIGSGFLAWVAYHTLIKFKHCENVDVLGSSNIDLWGDILLLGTTESYDVVIDLSGKYELGTEINLNNNALIVDAVGKAVSREEAQQQLWKAVTTVKPSPRNTNFHQCMKDAVWMIENGYLEVDSFWTRGYNRNIEWQEAFADGKNRPSGYSRGYIKWD
jgi:D-arabinose 1-dehydrogenase-like Zn-dependent alcohol dehydrogenase